MLFLIIIVTHYSYLLILFTIRFRVLLLSLGH